MQKKTKYDKIYGRIFIAAKEDNMAKRSFGEELEDRAERGAKRYVRKKVRRLNGFTLFFCILAFAAGVAAGIYAYEYVCANDTFSLKGEREIAVALNAESFVYADEGVEIIEFGRDISDTVKVDTNMTLAGEGSYTVDTSVPGRYYIKYTVESPKYGAVCRIRTVVVGGNS